MSPSKDEKFGSSLILSRGLIAIGIALGYIILLYSIFGLPYYETCDDILLTSIVSGVGFVDSPDPHILYSNILVGIALSELYKLFPNFSWYGFYLISSQFIAIAIIVSVILRKFTSRLSYIPILLFLLTCLRSLLLVQFTTTACLVAASGSALLLYSLEHVKLKQLRKIFSIASILLYWWSSMIRVESAYLVIALTLLVVFLKQVKNFNLAQLKLTATTITISLALILGFCAINENYYQSDKSWAKTYNKIKASWSLINTERLHNKDKQTESALKDAKWKIDDVYMLRSWYLLDPKFNNQALVDLDEKVTKSNPGVDLKSFAITLLDIITDRTVAPNILVLIVFLILLNQARFSTLSALLYFAGLLSIFLILALFSKFPPRVMAGILQISAISFLLYSSPGELKRLISGKLKFAIAFSIMAIFLSPSIGKFYTLTHSAREKRVEIKKFTKELSENKDTLYVLWGAYFPYKYISPFDNLKPYFGNLKLIGFNSLLPSPIFQKRLDQFEITDFITQLDKENVNFLVSSFAQVWLETYIENKFQKLPVFNRVKTNRELNISAYKIKFHDLDDLPEPPKFEKSSLIVFPENFKGKVVQLNTISMQANQHTYSSRGLLPMIFCDLENKNVRVKDYSDLLIELKLESDKISERKLGLYIDLKDRNGQFVFIRLSKDDKMHRYVCNFDRQGLKPEDKITKLFIYPTYKKVVSKGELITVGRIGLLRDNHDTETVEPKPQKKY